MQLVNWPIASKYSNNNNNKKSSFLLFCLFLPFKRKCILEDLKGNGRKNNLPSAGECRKERQELGSAHRFVMMNHVAAVVAVVVVGNVRSVLVLIVV